MSVGNTNYPTTLDTAADLVEAANRSSSTLSAGIDNNPATTTIPLVSASTFTTSGIVAIDDEIISYTGKSGNSLTGAVRAFEGTSIASHSSGAAVRQLITAASHNVQSAAIIALETKLGTGTDIAWTQMTPLTVNRVVASDGTGDITASPITHDGTNAIVGNVGAIDFDDSPTVTAGAPSLARLTWNDGEGTLNLTLKGGNVTVPLSQRDTARVVNGSGTNLLGSNYQVVRVTTPQGQRIGVTLAQADNETNSADVLGLISENINNNNTGTVTTRGVISGINTTGSLQGETWVAGDVLFLSPTTAGGLTKVKPVSPNHLILVGYVVYAHATEGKIFVAIQTSWEIEELHDVKITGTPAAGSLLIRNATGGIWENATLTAGSNITITNADKSITINSTASGSGDVVGPASSTNNAVARFDGITGKLLKNTSALTVSDTGALSFPDGVRQTFNPNSTNAGINVGAHTSDPSAATNGDLWYNSASGVDQLRTRRGGATENVATIPATIGDEIPVMSGNLTATGELLWDSVLNGVQIGNVNTGVLTLAYAGGTNGTTLAPPSTGGLVTLTLPAGTGSNGQALTTNGAGTTAWSTVVTSVTGTAPVSSSGGATPAISLASGYGDTLNPYTSKTQNTFLAAPNGSAGTPSFRSIAAADLPAIDLTSGVTGVLPVANGGTNASTVSQARINLLPSYTGNGLRVLRLNSGATDVEWATVSASPGGSDTQVQFNNSGTFGGNEGLVYNTSTANRNVTVSSFAGISSLIAQRAEGTSTSPTAVQGSALTAGQVGRLDFMAYNGSTYEQAATIRVQPGATFDTSNGGKGIMYLSVKPANRASDTQMGTIAVECRTSSSQAVNLYPTTEGALGNSTFQWTGLHLKPSLTLYNNSNSNTITIASSTPSSSYTLTLPTNTGTNGQVLTTNGSGVLSWAAVVGGGSNATAEGRLTLASGTPFTTTDQTAKTTLYYTPYNGNRIALFNGTSTWTQVTFTERSITIPFTTNTNYDVFIWNDSGTATLELTAWTNNTTRATALTLQDGIYVRSGDTTRRYIGTIRTTGTSGQCEDSMKSRLVWNMYNQELRGMECRPVPLGPPTDTHYIYTTAVWRAAGNNTTLGQARVDFVIGLPVYVVFSSLQNVYNGSNAYMASSIGLDRTNGNDAYIFGGSTVAGVQPMINAEFRRYVDLGYHYLQRVEISAEIGSTLWYVYANATGVEAVRSGSSGFLAG